MLLLSLTVLAVAWLGVIAVVVAPCASDRRGSR